MPLLDLAPRVARPDDFYDILIAAHGGLSDEQSIQLNARLILVLANQIGDMELLEDAVATARAAVPTDTPDAPKPLPPTTSLVRTIGAMSA